eukprot:s1622_g4.t1
MSPVGYCIYCRVLEASGRAQLFREAQRRACLQLWFSSAHGAKTVDPRLSDPGLCGAQILEKSKDLAICIMCSSKMFKALSFTMDWRSEVREILENLSKRIFAVLQRVSLLHLASNEPRPRNAALRRHCGKPRSKKAQMESEIRKSPSGRLATRVHR